jgi:hypothetical protein
MQERTSLRLLSTRALCAFGANERVSHCCGCRCSNACLDPVAAIRPFLTAEVRFLTASRSSISRFHRISPRDVKNVQSASEDAPYAEAHESPQ